MRDTGRERREGKVRVAAGEVHATVGFRLVTDDPLAGGPVELEFFVWSTGPTPLPLALGGDMARQRPGQFSFKAELDGLALADPRPGVPNLGGPLGVVEVKPEAVWRQPVLLNDFIRLEDTVARLRPGQSAGLRLRCERPIVLAATSAAALEGNVTHSVEINLAFGLRRADAELADLAERLLDTVLRGPVAGRERPLSLLLSMRGAARPQIEALTKRSDEVVADRARQVAAQSW